MSRGWARVPAAFRLDRRPMVHWKALFEGFPVVPGAGRVLGVPWLSGRPMAHWKDLFEGFPTVPGAGSVSAWFSYRDRLSVWVWFDQSGWALSRCTVNGLACRWCFG
eukprot:scaffold10374_cov121-Isochrysis_galbana.AAC.5